MKSGKAKTAIKKAKAANAKTPSLRVYERGVKLSRKAVGSTKVG